MSRCRMIRIRYLISVSVHGVLNRGTGYIYPVLVRTPPCRAYFRVEGQTGASACVCLSRATASTAYLHLRRKQRARYICQSIERLRLVISKTQNFKEIYRKKKKCIHILTANNSLTLQSFSGLIDLK